ncbi:hypothetical protein B0J11DRAFT_243929 [Dendryphion nanum]|uniref:Rhodopsin domain-containing protein n=1 Tax=Dendryphion nanum TaxID=256645 RepID=A0A9P9E2Y5_9PLEO|nr:hypothetical protein B0J11DRAFT_243929 [Dendryphion nanum]
MSQTITPEMLATMSPEQMTPEILVWLTSLASVDRSRPLLDTCIALIVLQTFFMAVFCFSRRISGTMNGVEFWWFMPLAYIVSIGNIIITIFFIQIGGAGRHVAPLMVFSPNTVTNWLKLSKAAEFLYFPSMFFPKLAILAMYMRIFSQQRIYRRTVYVIGICLILWGTAGIITSLSYCRPFAYQWDKTIPGGKCGDIMAAYRWISVPNIVADLIILVLPLPAIYNLQIDLANKIGLFLTFLIGSFGLVATVVRSYNFWVTNIFEDPTYDCITTLTWTIVEPAVCLISATLPSLRPLKRKYLGPTLTSSLSSLGIGQGSKRTWKSSKGSSKSSGQIYHMKDVKVQSTVCTTENQSTNSTSELCNHEDSFSGHSVYQAAVTTVDARQKNRTSIV